MLYPEFLFSTSDCVWGVLFRGGECSSGILRGRFLKTRSFKDVKLKGVLLQGLIIQGASFLRWCHLFKGALFEAKIIQGALKARIKNSANFSTLVWIKKIEIHSIHL